MSDDKGKKIVNVAKKVVDKNVELMRSTKEVIERNVELKEPEISDETGFVEKQSNLMSNLVVIVLFLLVLYALYNYYRTGRIELPFGRLLLFLK